MTAHWPHKALSICLLLAAFCLSPLTPTAAQSELSIEQTQTEISHQPWIRIGRGEVKSLSWRPGSDVIAVGSSMGIGFHNPDLDLITFIDSYHRTDAVVWSNSGNQLAITWLKGEADSLGYSWHVSIWDVNTQSFITELETSSEWAFISSVHWCPNEDFVVGLEDHEPVIWNTDTGEILLKLSSSGSIRSIICFDDHSVKVITNDCHILTYSGDEQEPSADISFLQEECHLSDPLQDTYRWDSLAQNVIFVGSDHTLRVIDSITGMVVAQLTGHSDDILAVLWAMDDSAIISTSSDGSMRLWHAETGQLLQILMQNLSPIIALALESNDQRFISFNEENILQLWDLNAAELQAEYHEYIATSDMRWSTDSRHMLTHTWRSNQNQIWDTRSGALIRTVNAPFVNDEPLAYLPYSSDLPAWNSRGDQFSALIGGAVEIFDAGTNTPKFRFEISGITFRHAAWNPAGTILATWGWDDENSENPQRGLWFWDTATGLPIKPEQRPQMYFTSFTWSPDGSRIAFLPQRADYDGVTVIDIASRQHVLTLDLHLTEIISASIDDPLFWTPDEAEIMGGYTDAFGGVLFWNALTGEQVYQHTTGGLSILHPNGRFFLTPATNLEKSFITAWDRQTDRLVMRYEHPLDNSVFPIVWNSTGTAFASQTVEGVIFVFPTPSITAETD